MSHEVIFGLATIGIQLLIAVWNYATLNTEVRQLKESDKSQWESIHQNSKRVGEIEVAHAARTHCKI